MQFQKDYCKLLLKHRLLGGLWIALLSARINCLLGAAPVPALTNSSPAVATNPAAIPASEIAAQAEANLGTLRAIETASASDSAMELIQRQLAPLSQEINFCRRACRER